MAAGITGSIVVCSCIATSTICLMSLIWYSRSEFIDRAEFRPHLRDRDKDKNLSSMVGLTDTDIDIEIEAAPSISIHNSLLLEGVSCIIAPCHRSASW